MKSPLFTKSIYIGPNDYFYLVFEQDDRRWYSLDSLDDMPIDEFASTPIAFKDLKTIQVINILNSTLAKFMRFRKITEIKNTSTINYKKTQFE